MEPFILILILLAVVLLVAWFALGRRKPETDGTAPVSLLVILLFIAVSYTFLHEAGHALLGRLFGGQVTAFNIDFITFGAHAGISGDFEPWQQALIAVGGVGLPVIVWSLFLLLSRPPAGNAPLGWLMLAGSAGVYGSLLAWVILPLLSMAGVQAADDSLNFLALTGMHPLLLSLGAALVFAGGLGLFFWRIGGLAGVRALVMDGGAAGAYSTPQARRTVLVLGVGILVFLTAAAAINLSAGRQPLSTQAPEGYTQAFELDMTNSMFESAPVYRFEIEAPAQVSFFFVMQDLKQPPFEVALVGPGGPVFTFLRFVEPFSIGTATAQPEPLALDPGTYEIRVTAPRGSGRLLGYLSIAGK